MSVLASVRGPADLRSLDEAQLVELRREIREVLVDEVTHTGGHLGPNLGVVELTIALHRVFDSPHDRILFDVGHQAYVHKMLTGRQDGFRSRTLRKRGGLSGYPSRQESEHDVIENSHASTALSYADGLAAAYALRGEDRDVAVVVGDGALTGGMSWEALNNIAAEKDRRIVIVVNDNGRSYEPTHGGFAEYLAGLRTNPKYEQMLALIKDTLERTPLVGSALYDALHGIKRGLKDAVSPQGLFEDLGLKYVGPVDGHDVAAVESALRKARRFGGPVIVHCVTQKGRGYAIAEEDEQDCLHQIRKTDQPKTWTDVFGEELVAVADERADVVGVTAAMLHSTGLAALAERHPDRVYDVGIAEQHAVTKAAGLAMGGLHPVVAIYATFLNRAFDQVLMDVALHRLPVTFVLDRAGVTGEDGASHNGMWDLSVLQVVPGLRIAAPRDGIRVRDLFREAVGVSDGPTVVRFPKAAIGGDLDAIERVGETDVLHRDGDRDVLLVAVGAMAATAMDAAERLAAQGLGVTVVDPRWVKPVDPALVEMAGGYGLVAVLEDNGRTGGVGATLGQAIGDAGIEVPVRAFGIPPRFLDHAKRAEVLAEIGLTAQDVAREIVGALGRSGRLAPYTEPRATAGPPR
ncbi:MAG: 1-deoxy-D-xylulose-5-phosphate synthase [Streptosporangiales bacterium]|nr:1-deoxy-D-xylulose-5-phosphate synthase [Streptosporangiales bacterium]